MAHAVAERSDDVMVLDTPAQAVSALHPDRGALLELLADAPDSASGLARRMKLPRQKVNYHLRELEKVGLVELVEERRRGNCLERVVRATATQYLIDPAALGRLGAGVREARDERDRFSWAYLVGVCAQAIRDLATLRRRADSVGKALPTFSIQIDARFASPRALHDFTDEMSREAARLALKHQAGAGEDGRLFRFFIGAHPVITKTEAEASAEAREHEHGHDAAEQNDRDGD